MVYAEREMILSTDFLDAIAKAEQPGAAFDHCRAHAGKPGQPVVVCELRRMECIRPQVGFGMSPSPSFREAIDK
jgi:hypothetical protein